MALAISSLPVPDSPRTSTVLSHLPTCRTWSNTRRMMGCARPCSRSRVRATLRRSARRWLLERQLFVLHLLRQAYALADEVGDHLQEALLAGSRSPLSVEGCAPARRRSGGDRRWESAPR